MKLPIERLLKLIEPAMRLIKRAPEARDAFGGEDLFDGDSKPSGMGPKIALAASGVLFLSLLGLVGAFIFGGEEVEPAGVVGTLADLQMEEDPGAASNDAISATDRSVERRPWLVPAQAGGARLGLTDSGSSNSATASKETPNTSGDAASGALPTREVETAAVMKPPPAGQDNQAAQKTAPPKVEPPKAAPVEPEAAPAKSVDDLLKMTTSPPPPPAKSEPTMATAPNPVEMKAEAQPAAITPGVKEAPVADAGPVALPGKSEEPVAGAMTIPPPLASPPEMPSLLAPAENVPGAPRRMAAIPDSEQNAAVAGSRPRLNDPRSPPTARSAIAAPPPRFANLVDFKPDAAAPAPVSGAKIAVVIEGLGLSQTATEAAINRLPTNVTLAFSPYARDLKRWIDRAKAKGHEVLIEVPMEGKAFPAEDPGPLGLLTVLDAKDNAERLETILKAATGAVGIFDAQGSKFRESQEHVNAVFTKLKEANLFYVQGRPGIRVGESEIPTATADVVVDERPFRAAVDARLDYAERLAKYQGSSIAVMSAKPVSYERLALWLEQLQGKGVNLTPVSGVLIQ